MLDIEAADERGSLSLGELCITEDVRDTDVGSKVDGGLPEGSIVGLDGPIIPGPRRKGRIGS